MVFDTILVKNHVTFRQIALLASISPSADTVEASGFQLSITCNGARIPPDASSPESSHSFITILTNPENFESIKKTLESMEPNRLEEEPIAFGLISLKFTKIIPDKPGTLENLEKELNEIKGVGSVENIMTSRAM